MTEFIRRSMVVFPLTALAVMSLLTIPSNSQDKPAADLLPFKLFPAPEQFDLGDSNMTFEGQFSKEQIQRFTCDSSGDPRQAVDISCNTPEFAQDFSPDNEIAIAVNPADPHHLVAGSNDYFYRFNNATRARQAIIPTGFFVSFDGGKNWLDGQVPMRTGNGAGDPSPAFDRAHGVVLMAQLENVHGLGGPWVAAGNVSVSRSVDGGRTWSEPVTVFKGTGGGPANQAVFWDKEWLTVDNNPGSLYYGRAYLVAVRFLSGLFGNYLESPVYLSWSDDGGLTWSPPKEISGSHASCTFQSSGPSGECDEDQFAIPAVAPDGTLYVHFHNYQNESAWEVPFDFDAQIMVVKSIDGGETFSDPVPVAQLEDGLSDMPFSVIRRQTIWGHQIRWNPAGNIAVNPKNSKEIVVIFADRGQPNQKATEGCFLTPAGGLYIGEAPNYDPCDAGPRSDTNVYLVKSTDGGRTWSPRTLLDDAGGRSQWFPWAGFKPDGTLVVAWDEDTQPAPADTFVHVLMIGGKKQIVGPVEHPDESVTHWAGQYVPQERWPKVCGPDKSLTPGKGCNVFHGDYTGLAIGPDGTVHIVWTGFNTIATSAQIDFYTGEPRKGYRQDAMYARRR